jgi:hypothetical protein
MPVDVADWPFGRISLEDPETVEIAVRSLLQTLEQSFQASEKKSSEGPILFEGHGATTVRLERVPEEAFNKEQALSELDAIKQTPAGSRGRAFEKFVSSLFDKASIPVATEVEQSEHGIDLAFWLDDVSRVIANPVLAEVKTRIDEGSWKENSAQLLHYLNVMRAQCGILVTLEARPPNVPRYTRTLPFVVTLNADELVSLLSNRELGTELIRVRNLAVHG